MIQLEPGDMIAAMCNFEGVLIAVSRRGRMYRVLIDRNTGEISVSAL